MTKVVFEVCAGSYEDCTIANQGGAHRIELNSALALGGLTPTTATLKLAKSMVSIPIVCMVRSRGAGFCYNDAQKALMYEEAKQLLEAGADGIVFGCLTSQKQIDVATTKLLVDLAHKHQKQAIFHRAIDVVQDIDKAFAQLVSLRVDRVLTSGASETAWRGRTTLAMLQAKYQDSIDIVAGVGISSLNVLDILKETKVQQVHASCKAWSLDATTSNQSVDYSYNALHPNAYEHTSLDEVKRMAAIIQKQETT